MCGGFYRDKERKLTHSQTARDDAGKIKPRVGTLLTFLRTGNVENAVAWRNNQQVRINSGESLQWSRTVKFSMRCPDVSWGQQQHLLRMLARRWPWKPLWRVFKRSRQTDQLSWRLGSFHQDAAVNLSSFLQFSSGCFPAGSHFLSGFKTDFPPGQPPAPVSSGCSSLFSSQNTNV